MKQKALGAQFDDPEILARWEASEIACQKIRHALAMGNDALADRCLAGAKASLIRLGEEDQRFLDRPLVDFLDLRMANVFEDRFGAYSVGDALKVPRHLLEESAGNARLSSLKAINQIFAAAIQEVERLENVVAGQDFVIKGSKQ